MIQPCYNEGVDASAGTHDKDAVLDIEIVGMTWPRAQKFLRECGWAAFWRHTGSWEARSAWHIHMASLGATAAGCIVGYLIDGGKSLFGHIMASSQYEDYYNHLDALADHGPDPSWHPADIKSTVFSYSAYFKAIPTVSLARAQKAARTPAWRLVLSPAALADSRRIKRALSGATYRQFQLRCGQKNPTGIPDHDSLTRLGEKTGFRVVA